MFIQACIKAGLVSIIAGATAILFAGCGHNNVTYSDGIGFETTANPETFTFGLNFRYGKIFTATVKEKTEVNLEAGMTQETAAGTSNTASSKTGVETKLNFKTGDQVTGYTVELEKAKKATAE